MHLEQVNLAAPQPQPVLLAAQFTHVKEARRQRGHLLRSSPIEHRRYMQRQDAGAFKGRGAGWLEHRVVGQNRLPIGPAGGPFGQAALAISLPLLRSRQEFGEARVIGRGHEAALAVDAYQGIGLVVAQVVVRQKEQVMGQFVGQRLPPISPQVGGAGPVRIPHRPHADLAALVGGRHRSGVDQAVLVSHQHRFRHRPGGHATNGRRRTQAVVRQHHHVGRVPVILAMQHIHPANAHLAIGDVEQHVGGAPEAVGQVEQKHLVTARIPLQRYQ